jgi:hypothetical protein
MKTADLIEWHDRKVKEFNLLTDEFNMRAEKENPSYEECKKLNEDFIEKIKRAVKRFFSTGKAMPTDEDYKAELEKFKEKMCNALHEINSLVFNLEFDFIGAKKPCIKDMLKLYGNIPDDIRNAFNELNKSKGDEYIHGLEDPTMNFVKDCALLWE